MRFHTWIKKVLCNLFVFPHFFFFFSVWKSLSNSDSAGNASYTKEYSIFREGKKMVCILPPLSPTWSTDNMLLFDAERHLPATAICNLHSKNSKLFYNKIFIRADTLILIFLDNVFRPLQAFLCQKEKGKYMRGCSLSEIGSAQVFLQNWS